MAEVGQINAVIALDTKRLERGAAKAKARLKDLGDAANKTSPALKRVEKASHKAGTASTKLASRAKAASSAFRALGAAAIAYVTIRFVSTIVKTADSFAVLEDRIRNASKGLGEYAAISNELAQISIRTGVGLEQNVGLFQRLALAAPALGASLPQIYQLTEAVNQLGVIGGSSTEELKNGLRQFAQGISSVAFRAEEFNSLIENTPEIANAIARGMGLTTSELQRMIIAGDVLSKDIFASLLSQTEKINEKFEATALSIGRAFTNLGTAVGRVLGTVGEIGGARSGFANIINDIAIMINGLADAKTATEQLAEAEKQLSELRANLATGSDLNRLLEERIFKQEEELIARIEHLQALEAAEAESQANRLAKEKEFEAKRLATQRAADKAAAEAAKVKAQAEQKANANIFATTLAQASSASKEFFAINKASTIAQILLDTPKAISGSYAFGSSIGGPILGAIFAGVAGAAQAGVLATAAKAKPPNRAGGGYVGGGRMYEVGERGTELLREGGRNYLLPARDGSVVPNAQGSAAPQVSVIVNNNAAVEIETEATTDDFGNTTLELDVIARQAVDAYVSESLDDEQSVLSRALVGA